MSSAEPRTFIRAAAAALVLAVPGIAQAAIVVASSGPSASAYPVGRKLPDNASITLRAGDTITILDSRGTRVLRGDGTFAIAPGAAAPNTGSTFAALTMQRAASRVRTGAVRSGTSSLPPGNPNLWFVDLSKSGRRCVVKGQPVRLWRLATDKAAAYKIASTGSAKPGFTASFPAGAMVAAWNAAALPIGDGGTYTVSLTGEPVAKLEFALLPSQPADPEALATALVEKGCTAQLDLLSTTLAQP
jgi:hypothetical protein